MKKPFPKMRVMFNTYPLAFFCPGGGEIQLLKTKEALEKKSVKVKLFSAWNPDLKDLDVVHYFSVMGAAVNYCSYIKKTGLPVVISPILWLGKDKDKYPLDAIKVLFDLCDLVLPNSKSEADQLSNFFKVPRKKFFVIRNGVDASFGSKVSEDIFRRKFNIKYPFILNVANIEERKNQLNLIRALKGMKKELVILGNIRDKNYFKECMKEGRGFVRYLGYIEHGSDLLKSAYRACSLFALPSLLETPSLAALEAAAGGANIVITEIGSTKEYFQEKAIYVDPYSVKGIKGGIEEGLGTKKNARLSKFVINNFTWDKTAEELISAYKIVLDR